MMEFTFKVDPETVHRETWGSLGLVFKEDFLYDILKDDAWLVDGCVGPYGLDTIVRETLMSTITKKLIGKEVPINADPEEVSKAFWDELYASENTKANRDLEKMKAYYFEDNGETVEEAMQREKENERVD